MNRIEIAVILVLLLIGAGAGYAAANLAGTNVRTETVTSTTVSVTSIALPATTVKETLSTTVTRTSTLLSTVTAAGSQQPFILLNSTSYAGTQHIGVVGWFNSTSGEVAIFVTSPTNQTVGAEIVVLSSTGYFQDVITTGGPLYQSAGTYLVNATSPKGVHVSTQFLYQP